MDDTDELTESPKPTESTPGKDNQHLNPRMLWPFAGGILFVVVCAGCFLFGRGSVSFDTTEWEERCDSISFVAEEHARETERIQNTLAEISGALDSVVIAEGLLLNNVNPETNRRYTTAQMRARVDSLGAFIARQSRRIEELESGISNGVDTISSANGLRRIVAYLRAELASKEQQIQNMRNELTGSRRTIAAMQSDIDDLTATVTTVREQQEQMVEALQVQNTVINECYVTIGTGRNLQDRGILTGGGFLRKRKLNIESFRPEMFQSVDISACREIPVAGDKIKILTSMPQNSYRITGNKGAYTLIITDPVAFWSISNYLVIQTD